MHYAHSGAVVVVADATNNNHARIVTGCLQATRWPVSICHRETFSTTRRGFLRVRSAVPLRSRARRSVHIVPARFSSIDDYQLWCIGTRIVRIYDENYLRTNYRRFCTMKDPPPPTRTFPDKRIAYIVTFEQQMIIFIYFDIIVRWFFL